ncbi:MAG: protein kinase [Deltaproteobacteria bacterium]|nr:protein kinase [Deltaproteobacteria bacterium]
MNPAADAPADRFGPYEVHERLGTGGMATVHRAKKRGPEGFERQVALKRMLANLAEDPSFVESFVREAKVASMLVHPNIAQVYDFGRIGGVYYIAMELVQGLDVRRLLRYASRTNEPIPLAVILAILGELCDALDFAHHFVDEHGTPLHIVHRDVSPSNLIVAHTGHVKVIDFGIAKANSRQLHTESGQIKGKLGYMSPEVVYGMPVGPVSDMFSVGVCAWELVTASPLFTTKTDYETMRRVREADIVPPSRRNPLCPPELDALILAALEREPERRLASAHEFRAGLDEIAADARLPVSARAVADWMYQFAQPDDAWGRVSGSMRRRSSTTSPPPGPTTTGQLSTSPPTTNIRIGRTSRPSQQGELHRSHAEQQLAAEVWGDDAPAVAPAGADFSFADEQRIETQSLVASQVIDRASQQPLRRATPLPMPAVTGLAMPLPAPPHTQVAPPVIQHHGHTPSSPVMFPPGAVQSVILVPAPPRRRSKLPFVVLGLAGVAAALMTYLIARPDHDDAPKVQRAAAGGAPPAPAADASQPGERPAVEKSAEVEQSDKPGRVEPIAKAEPVEKVATETIEKSEPVEKSEKSEKIEQAEKPEKPEEIERSVEKPVETQKTVVVEKREKPRKQVPPRVAEKPEAPAVTVEKQAPAEKPVPDEKTTVPIPEKPAVKPPTPPVPPEKPARTPVVAATAVTKLSGEVPTLRGKSGDGDVLVKMCIDESGRVASVKVMKADPEIAGDLQRALTAWRYKPYIHKDGRTSPVCFGLSLRVVRR